MKMNIRAKTLNCEHCVRQLWEELDIACKPDRVRMC